MKVKRIIANLLFFISILMVIVPVMPHHHHNNGLICMKNDLEAACCESADSHQDSETLTHHQPHHHCCCNTGCTSAHFIQKAPSPFQCDLKPDYLWVNILYFEPVFQLLIPDEKEQKRSTFYLETLHSILATTSGSLRAPPALLA